jgi:hypothetical protein
LPRPTQKLDASERYSLRNRLPASETLLGSDWVDVADSLRIEGGL